MVMDKDNNLNSTDSGFELDKVDVSRLIKPPTAPPPKKPHKARPTPQPDAPVATKTASSKTQWITAGACVFVVVMTAIFWIQEGKIKIPLPSFKSDKYSKPDTYISIGPVISSVRSGDLIKMTLDINCVKKSYRQKVADLDSQIRNRVVWALQTPEAEEFLNSGDYLALRGYLIASVMEIIPAGTATEIYISEFLRY